MEDMTRPEDDAPAPLTVEDEELLARSARLLAREDPEAFIDVSARVRSTVRATTRRSRPVHARYPDDPVPGPDEEDVLVVREWVLVGRLREAVAALEAVTPTQIRVRLDEDRCAGVAVHVTVAYGAVVAERAAAVRETVRGTLERVLGVAALPDGGVPVDVTVDDVEG